MADVIIKVSSANDGAGTKAAADSIERIGDEASKAAPRLTGLEGASRRTGREVEGMGDKFDETRRDAQQLTGRLLILSETTKDLGRQFAATGKQDVLKEFLKQSADLNRTRRVAKTIGIDDPTNVKQVAATAAKTAKEASGTFASVFQGGIIESFKALPSEAKLALGASAAAMGLALAGPLITTVNSLLLAGIGGGALAIGIALAAKDPAVQSAYGDLGEKIQARLAESVRPFRSELIESADIFDDAFAESGARIDSIFAGLAQEVKPLSQGLADAGKNMLPGLERAIAASRPLIRTFANELPRMGKVLGDLFDSLADAGPGLTLAFKFVLITVQALIKSLEIVTRLVSPIANDIANVGEAFGLWDLDKPKTIAGLLPELGEGAEGAADGFGSLSDGMRNTADEADRLNEEFDRLFNQFLSQDEANLRVAQGLADLNEELRSGTRTLDESTQAGRDNVESVLTQIDALNRKREADIAAGNGTKEATEAANAAYASQVEAIRRLLIQLGYPPAAIDAIIGKYQQLAAMPDITKTIRIYTYEQAASGKGGPGQSRGSGFATGGIVSAAATGGVRSGMVKVGEEGWEYARLPTGTMVYSHANSRQMEAQASQEAASGGASAPLLLGSDGSRMGDLLVDLIAVAVRKRGGDPSLLGVKRSKS